MRQLTITILVALTLAACADPNAYAVPDKQQWTDIGTAVRDYYALRNQLTAGLTIEDFWRTYPDLDYEHDLGSGIDLEVMLWKWSHDPQLVRLNYRTDIESYQPVRYSFARTKRWRSSTASRPGSTAPEAGRRRVSSERS